MRRLVIEVTDELDNALRDARMKIEMRGRSKQSNLERETLLSAATMRGIVSALLEDSLETRDMDELEQLVMRSPLKKRGRPKLVEFSDANKNRVRLTDDQRLAVGARKKKLVPAGTKVYMVDLPWYEDEVDVYLGIAPSPVKKGKRRTP